MKAHLIVARLSEGGHGLFLVSRLFGNHSLSVEKGKFVVQAYLLILINCRYSLLPALSLDGIIWTKIVEGSFTGPLFNNSSLNF